MSDHQTNSNSKNEKAAAPNATTTSKKSVTINENCSDYSKKVKKKSANSQEKNEPPQQQQKPSLTTDKSTTNAQSQPTKEITAAVAASSTTKNANSKEKIDSNANNNNNNNNGKKSHQNHPKMPNATNRTFPTAPFYVYSQNRGGSAARQWAPGKPLLLASNATGTAKPAKGAIGTGSGSGADYHPRQQRSQQFMVRYQQRRQQFVGPHPVYYRSSSGQQQQQQQQQPGGYFGGPRRQHLMSCNDETLFPAYYHGQRRKSRSINGGSPRNDRLASNSPQHNARGNSNSNRQKNLRTGQNQRGRDRSSHSETVYNAPEKGGPAEVVQYYEETFSESGDEKENNEEKPGATGADKNQISTKKRSGGNGLTLPLPQRRLHTLSGTVPSVGYSPVWGGPTMCLNCFEFFDLPDQTRAYVEHLLSAHKLVIADIELIVDLKRYIEYWRHRLADSSLEKILSPIEPSSPDDPLYGKVDKYYLMSAEKLPEDMQIRQRLAMRRLEEVLACQQREREDQTFARQCLFCRYQVQGNRSKLIHHLYMIHHLNLGSPDNLVFVTEYLDILEDKLQRGVCIYCENDFANQHDLDAHMREKGHREVNPNNSYYDKFYVINYLELGKKWIDVLAEDFEDTMPTFQDSEEEEEEQTWNEWEEDNAENEQQDVLCLLCDKADRNLDVLLQHMKDDHDFDLKQMIKTERMDFYERVKFVNYIRACCHHYQCFVCGKDDLHSWAALSKHLSKQGHQGHTSKIPERKMWDKDEFLIPTFENDSLLCLLDDLVDDEMDDHERARRSLPPDPAILDNGPVVCVNQQGGDVNNNNNSGNMVQAEDAPDLSRSILNDKQLRDELN